jgi:hypothetical protein
MRGKVVLIVVLAILVMGAIGASVYLRAGQPEPDVPELALPEGHRECPAGTAWVVVQGEEGPIEVPIPLDIPLGWTGKYEVRTEGNVGYWDYVGDAGSTQPIFAIAVMTEAQWGAIQGEPHGEALFGHGGLVWAYSPALDNPFSGGQADEFQRLAGEAYQIAGSLGTFFLPADPAQAARQVLLAYFGALRAGRYAEAARLYGGSYEALVDMNPEIDPQSHAALLEAACTVNGFMCQLEPATLVQVGLAGEDIEYAVELQNADGSPFELECPPDVPECATRTEWTYTVRTLDSQYFVLELPVHVP